MWTTFWDMDSGGSQKEQWTMIFIEASEDEAVKVFYNRFGHSPSRVTCTCCGDDYSIDEEETIEEATKFHRECSGLTVAEYGEKEDVLYITKEEIAADEKEGDVPDQGYVWV